MIFYSSWDDGHVLDIILADLLNKYELPGTFFISHSNPKIADKYMLKEFQYQKFVDRGFEIGGHTISHPEDLKVLNDEALDYEIVQGKEWLQDFVSKPIKSFCPPSGKYNDIVLDFVKKAGFETSRTTVVMNTDIPKDPFRIETTIHVYPKRAEYKGRDWLEVAIEKFNEALDKGNKGYFHIWGHSWEIDKYNMWDDLEKFFKIVKQNSDKIIC